MKTLFLLLLLCALATQGLSSYGGADHHVQNPPNGIAEENLADSGFVESIDKNVAYDFENDVADHEIEAIPNDDDLYMFDNSSAHYQDDDLYEEEDGEYEYEDGDEHFLDDYDDEFAMYGQSTESEQVEMKDSNRVVPEVEPKPNRHNSRKRNFRLSGQSVVSNGGEDDAKENSESYELSPERNEAEEIDDRNDVVREFSKEDENESTVEGGTGQDLEVDGQSITEEESDDMEEAEHFDANDEDLEHLDDEDYEDDMPYTDREEHEELDEFDLDEDSEHFKDDEEEEEDGDDIDGEEVSGQAIHEDTLEEGDVEHQEYEDDEAEGEEEFHEDDDFTEEELDEFARFEEDDNEINEEDDGVEEEVIDDSGENVKVDGLSTEKREDVGEPLYAEDLNGEGEDEEDLDANERHDLDSDDQPYHEDVEENDDLDTVGRFVEDEEDDEAFEEDDMDEMDEEEVAEVEGMSAPETEFGDFTESGEDFDVRGASVQDEKDQWADGRWADEEDDALLEEILKEVEV